MSSFYEEDLAYIHQAGFGDFARKVGDELLRIMRDHTIDEGLVIDLGCGSGIWASRLVEEGFEVLGVDVSEAMIDMARDTVPGGSFRVASIYEVSLPPAHFVSAMGEVLNYTVAADPSPGVLNALFEKIAGCLTSGGLFAFDIIVQSSHDPMHYRTWQQGDDWAVLIEVSEDQQENVLTREMTIFRELDGAFRRSHETHRVRILDAALVADLLGQAGFEVAASSGYGGYELSQRRLAFVATRR